QGGISFRRARIRPFPDGLNLCNAQTAFSVKVTITRQGFPRRHQTRLSHFRDQLRTGFYIFVTNQGKGRGLTLVMTGCAVTKKDGSDIPGKYRRGYSGTKQQGYHDLWEKDHSGRAPRATHK